jgi:hypothetical protein
MLATYDLAAVRHFTEDLSNRRNRCDNGEGQICSSLEQKIGQYVRMCEELRSAIKQWARAIFAGDAEYDSEVERVWKTELTSLLHHAKQVAAQGRAMNWQCYELQWLDSLHYCVADFDYVLANWVSPRLSTSPAPRTRLSEDTKRKAAERLEKLAPLSSDWQPTDPEQLAFFQKQKAR